MARHQRGTCQVEHYQCKERRVAHQEIISTEQEPFDEMALEI